MDNRVELAREKSDSIGEIDRIQNVRIVKSVVGGGWWMADSVLLLSVTGLLAPIAC